MFAGEPSHVGIYALARWKCWISSQLVKRHKCKDVDIQKPNYEIWRRVQSQSPCTPQTKSKSTQYTVKQMYPSSENKMMFAGEPPHVGMYALAQRKCWISSQLVKRHKCKDVDIQKPNYEIWRRVQSQSPCTPQTKSKSTQYTVKQMYPSSENKMMFAGEPPHVGMYALAQRKCWISSESVERHIHIKNTSRKGVHINHICFMRTRWSLQESLLTLEYTRWHNVNAGSPHSRSKDIYT